MGVVYYANYLVWFELGRTDWIRAQGVTYREFEEQGILLPVVQASCAYKSSAHYDDLVCIATTVTELTRARVTFGYRVTRQTPEPAALLAEGRTEHVFLTRAGRLIRLDRHRTSGLRSRRSSRTQPVAGHRRARRAWHVTAERR